MPVWFYLRGEEYSAQVDACGAAQSRPAPPGPTTFADAVDRRASQRLIVAGDGGRARRSAGASHGPSPAANAAADGSDCADAVHARHESAERRRTDSCSATTSSSASTTCRRRRRARRRCASRTYGVDQACSTSPTTRAYARSCAPRTTASRRSATTSGPTPSATRTSTSSPCMPYAHKYANAVTEDGILGAAAALPARTTALDAAMRGGPSLATKDIEGIITLLVDAEMKMFHGLQHPGHLPPERRRRPAARPRLRRGVPHLRRPRARKLRRRARLHHHEHAAAARGPDRRWRRQPDRLLQHQQDRLPHVRRHREPTSARCSDAPFRPVAMSVFASGAIPAAEALEWVCAQPDRRVDRVRCLEPGRRTVLPRSR